MPNTVVPDDGELRIVVVGSEGHGKSTVANAIMGKDHFAAGSKTTASEMGETSKAGLNIKVVDTPDLSESDMKGKEKREEVNRWKEMVAPYANIILLVIKSDSDYTEKDFIAWRQARRFWGGRKVTKGRVITVFTFADGQDVNEVGDRMEDNSPKWMGKVFKDCGGRFLVFKGKGSGNFLEEVMLDDDDDESDDEEEEKRSRKGSHGSRKGSGKGSRKGSGKKRHGSPKGRRGSHGKCKGHHKPKGGRGRRRGHSGKRRGGGGGICGDGGIMGILFCCCNLFKCKK
ncbi:GTPase IMAP family member 2-like [Babylonia areolata]|uniref:GTPase IMAP family member 2-like n=1 Tax=Babylonia areolata TaxID=304850 RepID=UPI003FD34F2E